MEAFFYGKIISSITSAISSNILRANQEYIFHVSTALAASDIASQLINVRKNSVPNNYNLLLSVVEQNVPGYRPLYLSAGITSILLLNLSYKPCLSFVHSSKFSKIYRCWIAWNRSIRVIIIPSILAFTYLGQHPILIN